MTALTQYDRLETTGLWRPAPDAEPREVVVSFGEATLVIADGAGRPLAHWSLAAVALIATDPGGDRIFAPDGDGAETLTLSDPDMIEAIARVHRAIAGAQPRPGRVRSLTRWGAVAVLLAAGTLWLPGALTRQVMTALPDLKRSEIGATVLGHVQRLTGPSCRADIAAGALDRLSQRLFGAQGWQIVVLPQTGPASLSRAAALPGQIILLPAAALTGASDPGPVAAALVAAAQAPDPMAALLQGAGLTATLTLLTQGDLPEGALAAHAAALVALPADGPPPPLPDDVAAQGPIMSDGDWVALQAICAG